MSLKARRYAMAIDKKWRTEGVPSLITLHEAHRLTDGRFGVEGDHETPVSLAAVAVKVAVAELKEV